MIPAEYRPDGTKNEGVSMQYSLVDTNLGSEETVVATLVVAYNKATDVTDFANWTLVGDREKVLSIASGANHAEAMYRLDCVLTNKNDSDITLTESSYLDVEVVNENVHLVGGVIDDGGTLTVTPVKEEGEKIGNTYREEVTAGNDTATMIFAANTGYEISEILHITSSHHDTPLDTTTTLFDLENGINNVTFETNGSYIFQATNVQSGQAIEVYTRPIVYTLITSHDTGSIIMDGTTFSYDADEELEVFFKAHEGYAISSVEVDGDVYYPSDMIADTEMFHLETDGTEILSGDVHLSKTEDHDVKVTSVKRKYNLIYKYYQQQDDGRFIELVSEQEEKTGVEFGAAIDPTYLPAKLEGDTSISSYTLRGWFATHTGTEFTDLVDFSEMTMPAKNVTYYAFREKDPDQTFEVPGTGKITKKLLNANGVSEANGSDITFEFKAVFHEQIVGEGAIPLGSNESEKEGDEITVTLTGLQLTRYNAGDPIYIYEVHNGDSTWIYDDARYAIYYDGTIKYADGTPATDGVVFTNQKAPYLVNYDLAGGNISGNTTIAPKIVGYTDANLLPSESPVKEDFRFIGWKKDTTVVDNNKTYSELAGAEIVTAITLVAQYERLATPIVPTAVTYIVEHYRVNQNGEYPTTPNDTETKTDVIGATVTAVAKTGGDYADFCVNEQVSAATKSATLTAITSPADIVTLKLYYDKDVIGGEANPDEGDEIPDIYQKKITFKVVNGTWANDTTANIVIVVNLLDEHGKYSKNGQADIASYIPVGMKANSGYQNGTWDTTPVSPAVGTEAVTYTYSFEKIPTGGGGGGVTRYTLTYESNGGTEYEDERYNRNTTVDVDKQPIKEGYVFEGWYEDKELTKYVEEVTMTKNITVYAKWVENNGGAGNGYDTPGSLNGEDHLAYVVGYPDGTVRPNANISRAEVTAIFFRLLKPEIREQNLVYENGFSDVKAEKWYNTAVSTMAKLGVVDGRTDTEFNPNHSITRAEFAAICARFDDSEFEVVDNFTDVRGHWAEHDIHEAAAHGWIKGYEDGTFKPNQFITRAEAMTLINRVLNRVPETADDLLADMIIWPDNGDKSAWYYLAVQEATNSHDYEMKNHIYEKWIALREVINWTKYE